MSQAVSRDSFREEASSLQDNIVSSMTRRTTSLHGDLPSMFDKIVVQFVLGSDERYVLPLLLSPFGYTTYRGS
jgi:5-hydroxyisourate hydrolase-like protein (transthyretin family)